MNYSRFITSLFANSTLASSLSIMMSQPCPKVMLPKTIIKKLSLDFTRLLVLVTGVSLIIPPNIAFSQTTYQARLYNCDDSCSLYINGKLVLQSGLNDDTGWQHIGGFTERAIGENEVVLIVPNSTGGYTYGVQIYGKQQYLFQRKCGVTFQRGCNGNSEETGNF